MAGNFWKSSHRAVWLLDREELIVKRHLAHRMKDRTSESQHQKILIFLCDFIQDIGVQLRMKQQVIFTATVYLKRFYVRHSFKSIDPMLLAPTAIYLAAKIEQFENMPLTVLINVTMALVSDRFKWAFGRPFPYKGMDVLHCELYLAECIDFSMVVYQPYRPLITYLDLLPPEFDDGFRKRLLAAAWTVVNDSLRTDAWFLYPPHQIAVACLLMAAVAQGRNDLQSWFVDLQDVDMTSVRDICAFIMDFYEFIRSYEQKTELAPLLAEMPKPVPKMIVVDSIH